MLPESLRSLPTPYFSGAWLQGVYNNRTPKEAWQNYRESQLGLAFQGISWKEYKLPQESLAFGLARQSHGA